MSSTAVLMKTVCLQLSISLWTGQRRLKPEDFGDIANQLPPKAVASLGSLKLCDPAKLDELKNLKRAAERACQRLCVRFLGGYATNDDVLRKVTAELDDLRSQFIQKAQAFVQALRSEIDDWKLKHVEWRAAIERALPDPSYVAGRLQFNYEVFRVQPVSDDLDDDVNAGLDRAIGGLSGQLFIEVEAEAEDAWKHSFLNRDAVGRKALRPIASIQNKLEALRYLDPRITPVIARIDAVFGTMPKRGPITGANLSAVVGLLTLLRDAGAMRAHGEAVLRKPSGAAQEDAFEEIGDESDSEVGGVMAEVQRQPQPQPAEPVSGAWFSL